nr:uncharacterized protein LOC123746803 [Procambarus clarkii]
MSAPAGAPPPWASILERLHGPSLGPEDHWPSSNHAKDGVWCLECALALKFLQAELAAGVAYETLVEEAIDICFTTVGYSELYCRGFISMVAPIAYHILSTNNVTASDACGEVLTSQGCTSSSPSRQWTLTIQGQKPPVQPILPPDVCFMHMYVEVILMQVPDVGRVPENEEDRAWYWGDYRYCGSPRWMLEDMLSHIKLTHPAPARRFKGEGNCQRADSLLDFLFADDCTFNAITEQMMQHEMDGFPTSLQKLLPHHQHQNDRNHKKLLHPSADNNIAWRVLSDTGIHHGDEHQYPPHRAPSGKPSIDNQLPQDDKAPGVQFVDEQVEAKLLRFTNPDDSDTPEELSADWLYQELARQWSRLVPQLDNSTVTRAAYYSVLLQPGFRIISFNSMFGYSSNLWLVEDSQDPGEELAWLEEQLNRAEASGELVHLLGHVPPGILEAERTWSREFNRIVVRYVAVRRMSSCDRQRVNNIECE